MLCDDCLYNRLWRWGGGGIEISLLIIRSRIHSPSRRVFHQVAEFFGKSQSFSAFSLRTDAQASIACNLEAGLQSDAKIVLCGWLVIIDYPSQLIVICDKHYRTQLLRLHSLVHLWRLNSRRKSGGSTVGFTRLDKVENKCWTSWLWRERGVQVVLHCSTELLDWLGWFFHRNVFWPVDHASFNLLSSAAYQYQNSQSVQYGFRVSNPYHFQQAGDLFVNTWL